MRLWAKLKMACSLPSWLDSCNSRCAYALGQYVWHRRSRCGGKAAIKWLLRGTQHQFALRFPEGGKVTVRLDEAGDFETVHEILGERIYDLDEVRFTPTLIIDAGSHIGMFTILAKKRFPDANAWCFEPDSGNCALLKRNLDDNQVRASVLQAALSNRSGEGLLAGGASNAIRLCEEGSESVSVRKLSEIIRPECGDRLLLKVDTEGAEWEILDDFLPHLPAEVHAFIEVHEGESAVYRLRNVVASYGLAVRVTRRRGGCVDCVMTRQEV